MPFKSQVQRGFMYANYPEMAKRWEKETPNGELPEHVRRAKHIKRVARKLKQLKDGQ